MQIKSNFANRGMTLEDDLNCTCLFYLETGKAVIHKKPTTIGIAKVSFQSSNQKRIKDGFFKAPSTTDYNGVWNGKYIDFEAKETKSKTSFPISNIHDHQIKHMTRVLNQNGICFLVIRFSALDKTFVYFATDLISFIKNNKRKSIPFDEFKQNGFEVKIKFQPRIDFLTIIERIYKEEK